MENDNTPFGPELCDHERLKLLEDLQDVLGCQVTQMGQACLLLSDLEYLSKVRDQSAELQQHARVLLSSGIELKRIVAEWCRRSRPRSSLSSQLQRLAASDTTRQGRKRDSTQMQFENKSPSIASMTSEGFRSQKARRSCQNRDDDRCIVTNCAGPIDVAHIVPFSLNKKDKREHFFNLLKLLWAPRIGKWQSPLGNGTEFIENLLCFAPSVHRYHAAGLFGLQPIEASSDGKSLKLKFWWLPQRTTPSSNMTDITDFSLIDIIGDVFVEDELQLKDIKICNGSDGHIIRSGDVIELSTPDPENLPLPNWDLLEMQWILQRLTALSGAAAVPDADLDDDDDEPAGRASFWYSEVEEDDIIDEGLHEWREEGHDEEAADKEWRSGIDNWIDAQPISPTNASRYGTDMPSPVGKATPANDSKLVKGF